MEKRPCPPTVDWLLAEHVAQPALDELVKQGCDRDRLRVFLGMAPLTEDSWKHWTGGTLKNLQRGITQIRDCAKKIKELGTTQLIYNLTIEIDSPEIKVLRNGSILAASLDQYANELERFSGYLGPKKRTRLHVWKSMVVAFVFESTGSWNDSLVASVISAALNFPSDTYSATTHAGWRKRNSNLIKNERTRIRQEARPDLPLPPQS